MSRQVRPLRRLLPGALDDLVGELAGKLRQMVEADGGVCHVFTQPKRAAAMKWEHEQQRLADWISALPKPVGIMACNDERGLQVLDEANKLAPNRLDLRFNRAKALLKAGQKDAGRRELEALQALPQDFRGKSEIAALLKGA